MAHQQSANGNNKGLWYTYFGKGGAGAFAFIWILLLLFWIYSVLRWG